MAIDTAVGRHDRCAAARAALVTDAVHRNRRVRSTCGPAPRPVPSALAAKRRCPLTPLLRLASAVRRAAGVLARLAGGTTGRGAHARAGPLRPPRRAVADAGAPRVRG